MAAYANYKICSQCHLRGSNPFYGVCNECNRYNMSSLSIHNEDNPSRVTDVSRLCVLLSDQGNGTTTNVVYPEVLLRPVTA